MSLLNEIDLILEIGPAWICDAAATEAVLRCCVTSGGLSWQPIINPLSAQFHLVQMTPLLSRYRHLTPEPLCRYLRASYFHIAPNLPVSSHITALCNGLARRLAF